MYTKAVIPLLFLAGQVLALPATTITLHSTITSTTIVPAITDAAGSNPSNAATPALFSPSAEGSSLTTLSSFSDASPFGATKVTVTVTETQAIPYPVLITVTDYDCPHSTAEVEFSTSAVSSESTGATVSSTAAPASSSATQSSETKSSPAPATTATKACVFPIPGKCDN
ncbi:hypothetical protein KCU77_g3839, partial [Aureobasidium melanogenum]